MSGDTTLHDLLGVWVTRFSRYGFTPEQTRQLLTDRFTAAFYQGKGVGR